MKKEILNRKNGIEALRILATFMIILMHYNSKSGAFDANNINYEVAFLIEALCACAVNCYVLISGYFSCEKEFKIKKVFKILEPTIFYSILIAAVMIIINDLPLSIPMLSQYILPGMSYWYVTIFLLLLLLSPYLNILIKNINQKQHKTLLIILLCASFFSSIIGCTNIYVSTFDNTFGYSIFWFITLYFTAAYIKKYIDINKINKLKLLLMYFISSLIAYGFHYLFHYININNINILYITFNETMFTKYNSITIFINSICLLILFLKLDFKNKFINKLISFIAPLTFSIYLIHTHTLLFEYLFINILKSNTYVTSNYYILYMIFQSLIVFIICGLIEKIRQTIFNIIKKIYNNKKTSK